MPRRSPTVASLFSGCGGFDLGFSQAGFKCIGAFDSDPLAIEVYRKNFSFPAQVLDLNVCSELELRCKPDVVIAGPPCQGFSTVGQRKTEDPRNLLLPKAARLAVKLGPGVVVLENVGGVIAGDHRRFWQQAIDVFNANKYEVSELVCDAYDFGVPQRRRRVVAVAWKTAFRGEVALTKATGGRLCDVFSNLECQPNHEPIELAADSYAGRIARRIGQNQKLCNVRESPRAVHTWQIPEVFGRTNKKERDFLTALLHRRRQCRLRDFGDADPVSARELSRYVGHAVMPTIKSLINKGYVRRVEGSYDLVHTFNGKFRRLAWDLPSPTVDTRFGDAYYFLHPKEHRALTIREAARIQGFPDDFAFHGSIRSQYRMIGNAVPPPLAKALAMFIQTKLLNGRSHQ